MKKIVLVVVGVIIVFFSALMYSLCVAAGKADRHAEKLRDEQRRKDALGK